MCVLGLARIPAWYTKTDGSCQAPEAKVPDDVLYNAHDTWLLLCHATVVCWPISEGRHLLKLIQPKGRFVKVILY